MQIKNLAAAGRFRFGRFEFDIASHELRKGGVAVRLRQQPSRLLAALLERPGSLVTRQELRALLWPSDVFVDFDQGLNHCVKEIRAAIGDNADAPIFVETLPRRGYRWIGPITPADTPQPAEPAAARWRPGITLRVLAGLAVGGALAWLVWTPGAARATADPAWQRVTYRRGMVSATRFGPSGDVAYTAAWDGGPSVLYVAIHGAPEARVAARDAARLVALTRRGDVLFLRGLADRQLVSAAIAGGGERALVGSVLAADASADGAVVTAVRRAGDGEGLRLDFPLGNPVARINLAIAVRLAHDTRHAAVVEHPVHESDAGHVRVFDRAGGARTIGGTWSSIEGLAWSPQDDEVWVSAARAGTDTSIYAIPLASGEPRLVLAAGGRLVLHDIDRDGRLLVERAISRPQVFFGRAGEPERELTWLDGTEPQDLTADGRALLFTETGQGGGLSQAAYLRPTDGAPPVRLGGGRGLTLAPDGRSALVLRASASNRLQEIPLAAGDVRVHQVPGIESYLWGRLLPDGRLLFSGNQKGHHMRVWLAEPGGAPRPITPERFVVTRDLLSPDGHTLVALCRSSPPGLPVRTMCLYPADGHASPTPVVGLESAVPLRWDAGGRALLIAERRAAGGAAIFHLDPRSGVRTWLRNLAPADGVGASALARILVTPDASAWVYGFVRRLSEIYVVEPAQPAAGVAGAGRVSWAAAVRPAG